MATGWWTNKRCQSHWATSSILLILSIPLEWTQCALTFWQRGLYKRTQTSKWVGWLSIIIRLHVILMVSMICYVICFSQYVVQNNWQKDSQEKRRSTFSSLRWRKKKAFGLKFNQFTKLVVQRDARSYVPVRFCKSFLKFKPDSLPR